MYLPHYLINDCIHNACHNKCRKDIKHGMLLDENGGQNNGNTNQEGSDSYRFIVCKLLMMHHCQMGTDGIIYMDALP